MEKSGDDVRRLSHGKEEGHVKRCSTRGKEGKSAGGVVAGRPRPDGRRWQLRGIEWVTQPGVPRDSTSSAADVQDGTWTSPGWAPRRESLLRGTWVEETLGRTS